MFFTNMILFDLCVSAPLRAQFHAKAQRRKVYCHYLDCWYELRTVIIFYIYFMEKTLKISEELHTRIKIYCAENKLKINDWVERQLNEKLDHKKK